MFGLFKKKKITVHTEETKEIDAIQTWRVRWTSVHLDGSRLVYTRDECEWFPSKELAQEFADRLIDAYKVLKISNRYGITIQEN